LQAPVAFEVRTFTRSHAIEAHGNCILDRIELPFQSIGRETGEDESIGVRNKGGYSHLRCHKEAARPLSARAIWQKARNFWSDLLIYIELGFPGHFCAIHVSELPVLIKSASHVSPGANGKVNYVGRQEHLCSFVPQQVRGSSSSSRHM
jgi:hypothetical protein